MRGERTRRLERPLSVVLRCLCHSTYWSPAVNDKASPVPNLQGVTVLLIDDDTDGRETVQRVLQCNRAEVVACASAKEALEVLETRIPTIIVCDLAMPDIDGLAFLAECRLREERRGIRYVPALALTGLDAAANMKHAARAGFQIYLQKPIEPEAFLRSVASLAFENPR